MKRFLTAVALATALIACSSTIQTPKTPTDAIAIGYVSVDTLAEGVEVAKRDGHISDSERHELLDILQSAKDDLQSAQQLRRVDTVDSAVYLQSAKFALKQVDSILKQAQSKK